MKAFFQYKFTRMILLLTMAAGCIPGSIMAQRFNHAGFGGGNRGGAPPSRPAPMPARQESRPAAPVRQEARPAAPERQEARPAAPAETINGGSRNFGNHDFNRTENVHETVNVHENVNIHENVNVRGGAAGRPGVTIHDHENVYHTGGYRGIHPYYYHPYRPYYWGPRWHPLGFVLTALAADAIYFSLNNQRYYYDAGCYYVPSNNGYSVVPAPVGAVVSSLPEGYETTMVGNDTFYYFGGAFYIDNGQGYQVVQAPAGAVVTQLPVGAIEQQVNGETLMAYNNVYYAPISQDGQDSYEVVNP
jgi:hypothetical protein